MPSVSLRVSLNHATSARAITNRLASQRYAVIPVGTMRTTQPIYVPSGAVLEGFGRSSVIECAGDFPAIVTINSDGTKVECVRIAGIRITRTNTQGVSAPAQTESHGLKLWGDDIVVEDVWTEDCYSAVYTDDQSDDPSHRITLRRVHYTHSNPNTYTSIFGFWIDTAHDVLIEDCTTRDTQLDGIKIRRLCSDVRVYGGSFNASVAGDGIDAYAGGGKMILRDAIFDDHIFGSGINIKLDDLNPSWGQPQRIEVLNCKARGNKASGLAFSRSAGFEDRAHITDIRVSGGEYLDNECTGDGISTNTGGIFIDARNAEIDGVLAARNLGPGLWLRPNARDVRVRGGRFVANGAGLALPTNIIVDGQRIVVEHPVLLGKDGSAVADDAAFDALDVVTDYPLLCQTAADDVTCHVRECDARGHTITTAVTCSGPNTGTIVIHTEGEGSPSGVIFGSAGSTFARTDGGADTSFYVKEAGPVNSRVGWAAK